MLRALGAFDDGANGAPRPPCYETRTNDAPTSAEALNRAGTEIVAGSTAAGATADGELLLADGARLKADVVIGADGVRSRVCDAFDLGQQRRRFADGLGRRRDARGAAGSDGGGGAGIGCA